jgi:hypothetical protein
MTYRNATLLALAQLAPHCMSCLASNRGQVVSAHSNQLRDGKGTAHKASDAAIAFLCDVCHHEVDQGSESAEKRLGMWELAHRRTMIWLVENGHLVVNPDLVLPQPPAPKVKAKIRSGAKIKSAGFPPADKRPKLQSGRKIPSRRMRG